MKTHTRRFAAPLRSLAVGAAAAGLLGAAAVSQAQSGSRPARRPAAQSAQDKELPPLLDPARDRQAGLKVGDKAPKVTVQDVNGRDVNLNSRFTGGLTVVLFYRGGWCPFCNKQMKAWGSQLGRFKDQNVRVIAISPETAEHTKAASERNEIGFDVFVDATTEAMRAFRVAFEVDEGTKQQYLNRHKIDLGEKNASGEWILPVPAVFIINEQGTVVWAKVGQWQRGGWDYTDRARATPDEVLEAVRELR